MSKNSQPKILFFDIETAPMLGYVWGLWENNVGLNQVVSDWYILSFAAKWAHQKKVIYFDQRNKKNMEDDSALLKKLWQLLDEADIVVAHNGAKFDKKKVNARFILNGMLPPSSYKLIDTYLIARRHFGFTSTKLEYLTNKLCTKYKKLSHAKFSGFSLWSQCLKGNKAAWAEMEKYNKYDVLSLEELYHKLIPWDNSVNFSVYNGGQNVCSCGSTSFQKNGYYYTKTGKFQRHRCTSCGSEMKSSENLLKQKGMLRK